MTSGKKVTQGNLNKYYNTNQSALGRIKIFFVSIRVEIYT